MNNSQPTATQKLDAVLHYLNDNRELAYHYGYGLPRTFDKPVQLKLTGQDILNVFDKLERDNMVRMTVMGIGNGNPNDAKHYCISLDGEVLLQKGGYTQKLKDEKIEQEKKKQDLRISKRNEKVVKWATVTASVVAFCIFLLELYKILCQS